LEKSNFCPIDDFFKPLVREILSLGGNISSFVPANIETLLKETFA
jgi:phosphopantetheine adenylyltransferase